MGDHLDWFQHIYRDWNQKADHLPHDAREKGTSWNSFKKMDGEKMEPVRAYFYGGVSAKTDDRVNHMVGSACVIQSSERIEEDAGKMVRKTIVEVAKVLPDDATRTQAETFAAVEAAKAICSFRTGSISFDLDGNRFGGWDKNEKRNRKKIGNEGGRTRIFHDEGQDVARFSRSASSSVLAGISDLFSVKEMTNQRYSKLGAKPKWAAHADQPTLACGETPLTPIPP